MHLLRFKLTCRPGRRRENYFAMQSKVHVVAGGMQVLSIPADRLQGELDCWGRGSLVEIAPAHSSFEETMSIGPATAGTSKASADRGEAMKVMVLVKATKDSEAGIMPSQELLEAMGKFNEEMVKAGIMLAGEGLQSSSKGARVRFSGSKRTVIDGPFAETKELVAGFWLLQVKSKQEAIEWIKRCPNPFPTGESEIEIRQVFEAADFGAEFTSELREQEDRMREQINKQK